MITVKDLHKHFGRLEVLNGINQHFMLEESTSTDIFGNTGKVLIQHTASTKIHMTDFRVPHLTIRQADIFT